METQALDQPASEPEAEGRRPPLTRRQVLAAAMAYVDDHGLAALTMRKLGAALGVEGTALYNHVQGKDGLLDGLVELIWAEVRAATDTRGEWHDVLRSMASATRSTLHRHPEAASLVCNRSVMPLEALQLTADCLARMEDAGFGRPAAAQAICAVYGHAYGYALMELMAGTCRTAEEPPESEAQRIRRIARTLPADVSPDLFEVGLTICGCDTDANFEAGIDMLITGLHPGRPPLGPASRGKDQGTASSSAAASSAGRMSSSE